jgi:hypothetical protein
MLTSIWEIVKYTKGFSANLIVAAHMGAKIPPTQSKDFGYPRPNKKSYLLQSPSRSFFMPALL